MIFHKTYTAPPLNRAEILKYAQSPTADRETDLTLQACLKEAEGQLRYKVCYCELPLAADGELCDFGEFSVCSHHLAINLRGCSRVVVFAATVGLGIDRLIAKYSRLSPAKALMFQAIGTERAEALCDVFCADMAKEYACAVRPRFSPGYGDLPLALQKNVFSLLDCERTIGITLNNSLLMSPTKSVTAFLGLETHSCTEV